MTATGNIVPGTSKITPVPDVASFTISPKQGIKAAWFLWWDSWKALIRGQSVTFTLFSRSKKEVINCNRHTIGYGLCDYDNPWCVWSV